MSVVMTESNTHQLAGTWLLVRFGTELYALPGSAVRELIRYRAPVVVPGAPPSLPGLINQRGAILTVVNMHVLLGLEQTVPGRTSRYIYVHHEDNIVALLDLDALLRVLREAL